jgi:hypothetical protein
MLAPTLLSGYSSLWLQMRFRHSCCVAQAAGTSSPFTKGGTVNAEWRPVLLPDRTAARSSSSLASSSLASSSLASTSLANGSLTSSGLA